MKAVFRQSLPRPGRRLPAAALFLFTAAFLLAAETASAAWYTSSEGGTAARVARFSVSAGEPRVLSEDTVLSPGDPDDRVILEIPVVNDSEVTVHYSVSAEGFGDILCELTGGEGELRPCGAETLVRAVFTLPEGASEEPRDISGGKLILSAVQVD